MSSFARNWYAYTQEASAWSNVYNAQSQGRSNALGMQFDTAAIWGKAIPVTFGRNKIPAYIMQLGEAHRKAVPLMSYSKLDSKFFNISYQVQFQYTMDHVVALGYSGTP